MIDLRSAEVPRRSDEVTEFTLRPFDAFLLHAAEIETAELIEANRAADRNPAIGVLVVILAILVSVLAVMGVAIWGGAKMLGALP